MRNIIIDCDPGHDDATAILLALANKDKINVKGITTVGGNQSLDKITRNALSLLTLVKEPVKVAKGFSEPLMRKLKTGAKFHGESGIDGPVMPEPIYKPESLNAVEFIAKIVRESKEKITIVAIAPLTNIAVFIKMYPELKDKIEMISIMGGGAYSGNVTPCAEFNIYVDPEAAKIVFSSGIPIVMSGLDVTNKAQVLEEEFSAIRDRGKVSKFYAEMMDFYIISSRYFGCLGCSMHDPCAVAYLIDENLFKAQDALVNIETKGEYTEGMTVVDFRSKTPNAKVLMDVNREEFVKLLLEAMNTLDKRVG